VYERLLGPRLKSDRHNVLLLGPRQVGKSTLLGSLEPDLTINLASLATFRDYVGQPERLERELLAARPTLRTVLIDEVQRVPALLDGVHALVDAHPRRFRFLLCGSSARKLRRGHANLLPGRLVIHYLHPLLASELGGDFSLDRVLAHGTLPGIYADRDAASRASMLRSYVDAYLREEVQAEALVRDIGSYSRLLDLVAASSGRVINLHTLSRDTGISYETARRYLDVLEDTLMTRNQRCHFRIARPHGRGLYGCDVVDETQDEDLGRVRPLLNGVLNLAESASLAVGRRVDCSLLRTSAWICEPVGHSAHLIARRSVPRAIGGYTQQPRTERPPLRPGVSSRPYSGGRPACWSHFCGGSAFFLVNRAQSAALFFGKPERCQ